MARRLKSSSAEGAAGGLIVNLDEFANLCGVTPETMRAHLSDAPADAEAFGLRLPRVRRPTTPGRGIVISEQLPGGSAVVQIAVAS